MIGWEVICKIVSNYYWPISPLFQIVATFAHFCTLFTILQLFGQIVITFSHSVTMCIMLYHVWHGFVYHFHHFISILALFGTLAHLSPQLFTFISPTILLVVYYFYHLSLLSQSFANFTSLHWYLNEHWPIWKVLKYTVKYTYLGKCEYNCKHIYPFCSAFGEYVHLLIVVIYVHGHVQK